MTKAGFDSTLTELAALKKSIRAAELKTIDLVNNRVEKLLNKFNFRSEEPYFTKHDFTVELQRSGGITLHINTLRLRQLPELPKPFVENEEWDAKPTWVAAFQSEITNILGLKKHGVSISIHSHLFPK